MFFYSEYACADFDCRWYRSRKLSRVSTSSMLLSSRILMSRGKRSANPPLCRADLEFSVSNLKDEEWVERDAPPRFCDHVIFQQIVYFDKPGRRRTLSQPCLRATSFPRSWHATRNEPKTCARFPSPHSAPITARSRVSTSGLIFDPVLPPLSRGIGGGGYP